MIKITRRIGVDAQRGDERRSRLEGSVLLWTAVVQEVTSRLSATRMIEHIEQAAAGFKSGLTVEQRLSDAHLLTNGLRQIERHLTLLKKTGFRTPQIVKAANQFFDDYNATDLKNLRDLLEHQADYLAGEGQKPHLVVDLNQPVSFERPDARGRSRDRRAPRDDATYHLGPLTRAVREHPDGVAARLVSRARWPAPSTAGSDTTWQRP